MVINRALIENQEKHRGANEENQKRRGADEQII